MQTKIRKEDETESEKSEEIECGRGEEKKYREEDGEGNKVDGEGSRVQRRRW